MQEVTVINHKEEFYIFLDKYFGGHLAKNLRIFEKEKKIQLMLDKIEFDTQRGTWCGTIYIKIKKLKAEDIINYIIGVAHRPDEVSMENKILRLWWD